MNIMSLDLLIGVLAAICLVTMARCEGWSLAAFISMLGGAVEVLLMLYAGWDAAAIEIAALVMALMALWLTGRRPG